jgi:hypothetical protein
MAMLLVSSTIAAPFEIIDKRRENATSLQDVPTIGYATLNGG